MQGVGGQIEATDTIKFLHYHEMPKNRQPTYAHFVCDVRPQKTEKECTTLTVRGNLIDYPNPITTRTCDLVKFKMHINSTLSRPQQKYCSFDIKNFYLNTPMERSEYMKIQITQIPDESLLNTIYKTKSTAMALLTLKYERECMGCLKLACWPTNY